MFFVFLSALCSVLVSVLLKLARTRLSVDVPLALTCNYLVAGATCALVFRPSLQALWVPGGPWLACLGLAILLPSLFLVLASSVTHAGVVRSDAAQRMSLVLSLLAAFFWFGEKTSALKLLGLALGIVAVLGIVARPQSIAGPPHALSKALLLSVWAGFALVDIVLKFLALSGTSFAAALLTSFALAFALMALWQVWRVARAGLIVKGRALWTGVLLGLLNFGNIIFYVLAHQRLSTQPALVFASMNIAVVVAAALVGTLGFGERLSWINRAALVLALLSIGVLASAAH